MPTGSSTFQLARKPPVSESNCARRDGHVEKDCSGTVGEILRVRPRGLGSGDESHDPGEGGLLPNCRDADAKASATSYRSRDNLTALPLRDRPELACDHRLVKIGEAFDDCAIRRNASSGPDEDNVVDFQLRDRNGLSLVSTYTFGSVREQRGECIERASGLGNGSHFEPMAQHHDRDQRCEFPPDFNLEEAKCCGERRSKSDYDCQADERHHAGLAVGELAPCPADEN
jgi:hypothetical protein